jgi:hypothetical protein
MISQIVINCERAAPQFNGDKELTVNAFSFDTSIFGAGITSSITHNPLKPDENYSERFQICIRFDTICTNVCSIVATDDGKVLLCEFSDEHGVMI